MALGKTLQEIETMPEPHLREYQQFYQEQPFGLWREDFRTAQIAYLLAAVNSDPKKSSPKLTDFMPFFADKSAVADNEDDGSEEFLANR
ncbi:phage tail assembly protein T [Testudinibacter sp. TR-2022]|uniref:phage tail assembly protein T n=1 Tax=Testudinibacter sp. TR-2022 TaxID=2585029 RepID=UPI003FA3D1D4